MRVLRTELARRMAFMTGGVFTRQSRAFFAKHQAVSVTRAFAPGALIGVLSRVVDQASVAG